MIREDIIRMAREAGFEPEIVLEGPYAPYAEEWLCNMKRFAALAAAAEREACAKVCERDDSMRWSGAASAIRARGQSD